MLHFLLFQICACKVIYLWTTLLASFNNKVKAASKLDKIKASRVKNEEKLSQINQAFLSYPRIYQNPSPNLSATRKKGTISIPSFVFAPKVKHENVSHFRSFDRKQSKPRYKWHPRSFPGSPVTSGRPAQLIHKNRVMTNSVPKKGYGQFYSQREGNGVIVLKLICF